ncbi:hypothetical protein GOV09_01770 [Candidatus Woesearchaeota archaeon]|nr:hypothetical protein [Candidatus Woesearchaeota archaeon]
MGLLLMKGIELCLRFSYITNKLRFCGPEEAQKHFLTYLENKDNTSEVEDSLEKFEGLWPYLHAIASKHGLDEFDYKVIEAYWIGNELLDSFSDDDMKNIVVALMKRGLPKSIGESVISKMPSGFFPHHNFNVFYVGVGNITGAVEATLQNMDNCRVGWGEVVEVGDSLIVKTQSLKKDEKFFLSEEETKNIVYLKEMLPTVKKGDIVALHWGFAPYILTSEQLENLKRYNQKIIDVLNS